MKYLSLFTGIGGFELGIQQAYECLQNLSNAKEQQHEATHTESGNGMDAISPSRLGNPVCVGFSEIDKYAISVYSKHFPSHHNYGDITTINATELPDFDLLVGGFPCQSFSIAGKRKGFEDTRGTLFFDIARILRAKQPRLLVLENVKGLLNHDNGNTFRTIVSTLTELGYDLQWQVLNSKDFGVPQNRERVFIVGHLRVTSRPEVFPFTNNVETALPTHQRAIAMHKNRTTYSITKQVNTLSARFTGRPDGDGRPAIIENPIVPTIRATEYKNGDNQTTIAEDGMRIRRLTPKECERLQGFTDNWTAGVSDTQRYKMCGNAVTVNVIQAIMEKLLTPSAHSKGRDNER